MVDYRFPAAGVDDRFATLGQDAFFPSVGVDARFATLGKDLRFEDPGFGGGVGWLLHAGVWSDAARWYDNETWED